MKKLVSTAIVLSLASNLALAQSSVLIYGIADAGFVHESGGPAGSVNNISSGVGSGNRLGFKGKEDLGGGASAFFNLENGYNIDTGSLGQGGLLFGRQAYVGVSNSLGAISLGRQYSPFYKTLRDVADPFEIGLAGTATNIIAGNTRVDNTAEYISPRYAGFSADLAYGFGEVAGDNAKNRTIGGGVNYLQGPLTVSLVHHRKNNATATDHLRTTMLVAKYDFGLATVDVAHAQNKGLANADSKDTLVGLTGGSGVNRLIASAIFHNDTTAADRDAKQWAIAYLYLLSKRSDLYAAYAHINNRNGATFTVGNGTDTGSGHTGVNLGVRHRF
jgi:predicted porin